MLIAKAKLNTIKILTSETLFDSWINHVLTNNALREYNEMKEEINILKMLGIYYVKTMEKYCISCKKNTANKNIVRIIERISDQNSIK